MFFDFIRKRTLLPYTTKSYYYQVANQLDSTKEQISWILSEIQILFTGIENDDILFTVISDDPQVEGALYSFPRQGYGDWRHLVLVPVSELADRLRALGDLRLEHVHDY